jgi:putative colanic acid biosynthesis UDP-glucose lipid carrier transferase
MLKSMLRNYSFLEEKRIHTLFIPQKMHMMKNWKEIFRLAEENKVHISLIPSITQNDFFLYDLGYIQTAYSQSGKISTGLLF